MDDVIAGLGGLHVCDGEGGGVGARKIGAVKLPLVAQRGGAGGLHVQHGGSRDRHPLVGGRDRDDRRRVLREGAEDT